MRCPPPKNFYLNRYFNTWWAVQIRLRLIDLWTGGWETCVSVLSTNPSETFDNRALLMFWYKSRPASYIAKFPLPRFLISDTTVWEEGERSVTKGGRKVEMGGWRTNLAQWVNVLLPTVLLLAIALHTRESCGQSNMPLDSIPMKLITPLGANPTDNVLIEKLGGGLELELTVDRNSLGNWVPTPMSMQILY